jgi:hypothetical protein
MASPKDYIQAQWELFHEQQVRNIAREMARALDTAEAFTKELLEHNRLLKENIELREELESGQ